MQVTEAIILAGGLGTRLREAVPDLPKCMAPVNGHPFIAYVIKHLAKQGIERFIFSLGYRSEAFTDFLVSALPEANYTIVIEQEPLGTGGAIQYAAHSAETENLVVVNGDSIFTTDIPAQAAFHDSHSADCTLALKAMENFSRYGVVEMNADGSIALFKEKQWYEKGLINGGVYIVNRSLFAKHSFPDKFSFETDYLQQYHTSGKIYGIVQEGYFIDIGIPEDYQRAQTELAF
ncbi:MAG: nucleotidyltransferase family protein [Bacteroidota bacterium]